MIPIREFAHFLHSKPSDLFRFSHYFKALGIDGRLDAVCSSVLAFFLSPLLFSILFVFGEVGETINGCLQRARCVVDFNFRVRTRASLQPDISVKNGITSTKCTVLKMLPLTSLTLLLVSCCWNMNKFLGVRSRVRFFSIYSGACSNYFIIHHHHYKLSSDKYECMSVCMEYSQLHCILDRIIIRISFKLILAKIFYERHTTKYNSFRWSVCWPLLFVWFLQPKHTNHI